MHITIYKRQCNGVYYYRSVLFVAKHFVPEVVFRKNGAGAAMFAKIFLRNFLIPWREPEQLKGWQKPGFY